MQHFLTLLIWLPTFKKLESLSFMFHDYSSISNHLRSLFFFEVVKPRLPLSKSSAWNIAIVYPRYLPDVLIAGLCMVGPFYKPSLALTKDQKTIFLLMNKLKKNACHCYHYDLHKYLLNISKPADLYDLRTLLFRWIHPDTYFCWF